MPLNLNQSPYYDDFDELKNYFRILFNPGRAVQARELTQAQTILHNQLSKNASHVFKDGSPILGGNIKVNNQKVSIIVDKFQQDGVTPVNIAALAGVTLHKVDALNADTGDKAVVSHYDATTRMLLIDYIGGDFLANDKLVVRDAGGQILSNVIVTSVGVATTATISDGLFYIAGSFVILTEQTIVVDWLSGSGNYHIGLQLTDSIVTSADDGTLVDPANGAYNFAAPGADRLKYDLKLTSILDGNPIPTNFYELNTLTNGEVTYAIKNVQYGDILDLLAKRTYDESGDYVVNPFEIFVTDDPLDNTKYQVKLEAGLAYIKGYEVSTQAPVYLSADKPRTTRLSNNEQVYADYGIFIDVDGVNQVGMFDIAAREYVQLKSGVAGTGSTISTCRIISISRSPSNNIRLWLEWVPSLKNSLKSTKSILGVTSGAHANNLPYTDVGQTSNVSLVYPLEKGAVAQVIMNETIITSVKSYHNVVKSTGKFTILADDNVSDFVGSGQSGVIQVVDGMGNPSTEFTYVSTTVGGGKSTLVITPTGGLTTSNTISVTCKLQRPTASPKTKTLTSNIQIFNSTGTTQNLAHYDVFRVTKVEVKNQGALDTTYVEVTSGWDLKNNDTDVSYEYATLTGLLPTKTYRVTYDYFAHSGNGDFFAINSYMTANNLTIEPNLYSLLGDYTSRDGTKSYSITEIIDFRRTPDDMNVASGVFTPSARSNIYIDYDYYLARHDKVVVSREGEFSIIKGVPDEIPESPESATKGVVTLYDLLIPAYVKKPKHIVVEENQLTTYTMSNIRELENRISNLEYYSSLSLLEKQANELNFVDEHGLNKFKNGIAVDNFKDFNTSNTEDNEYRSTIDNVNGILRCPFVDDVTDFKIDSLPVGVVNVDDQIMFSYTATNWINQSLSSGTVNLMPYDVVNWEGVLKLKPSSDVWVDNVNLPDIRTTLDNRDSATVKRSRSGAVWNSWQSRVIGVRYTKWKYTGIQRWGGLWPIRATYVSSVVTTSRLTRQGIAVVPRDIVRQTTTERELSRTDIPFMRAKSITYTAKALRPKTNFNALFDDVNVNMYCNNLTSDSSGNLTGTFNLPAGKFRTGTKLFKLVDADHGLSPLSTAGASYTARGTLVKHQRTITTIRQTVYTTRVVSQAKNVVSTRQRTTYGGWYDPVAQSFRVDGENGGVFLESAELYFELKSDTIPVQIYLVTMENGIPTSNIIPGSNVSVPAANVNVSSDSSLATKFTFDAPIHLNNNSDYAIVVMSNCKDYFMFHSELGKTDLITGKRIIEQPYLGSMFLSQNAATWTPEQTKDVKFKLNKCVFQTGTKVIPLTNDNTILAQDAWVSTFTPNFEILEHHKSTSSLEYKFSNEAVYTSATNKENVDLSVRKTLSVDGLSNLKYNISLTNNNPNVTPILDAERLSSVIVYNDVINIVNPTPEEINGGFYDAGTYVSKTVKLSNPSDDLRVMFDAKLGNGSRTKVYYKASNFIPKYVEVDVNSKLHDKFKNNTCYVYWYNSATGSWSERSTIFVTKNDSLSSPKRVYISKVGDYTDFIDSIDFAANSVTNIFISDHNIDNTITNIGTFSSTTTYTIGEYVFYNGELFVSNVSGNLNNIPTGTGTAWELIETTGITSIINEDPEASWKAMKQQNVVDSSVNTSTQYVEYTFIPDDYPEDDFTEFAVKIEMQSTDFTNIPLIKNFRAIALI